MNNSINAYEALLAIKSAVEMNHEKLREEPDSDGNVHDQWQSEEDALTDLEDSLDEAISIFEESMEVRKSLKRMIIKI